MEDDAEEKDAAYDAIEEEVQQTILEIAADKSLDSFREEYEKLAEALKKSHENEERLIKKCRELNVEIQQNTAKVQTAIKLSQEDQMSIEAFKQQIDRNSHLVAGCQEKEAANKALIIKLKTEIQDLTNKLDHGSAVSQKQEIEVIQLTQQRDALSKERDMAKSTLDQVQHVANEAYKKYAKMEKELEKATLGIETMKEKLQEKRVEQETEQKRKDALDSELKAMRVEVERLTEDSRLQKKQIAADQDGLQQVETQMRELEIREHELEMDYKRLVEEKKSVETKVDQELQRKRKTQAEIHERTKMLEAKAT